MSLKGNYLKSTLMGTNLINEYQIDYRGENLVKY